MPQQNQIVAVVKDRKERWARSLTEAHNHLLKPEALNGFIRTFRPSRDDEPAQPTENKRMQSSVPAVLANFRETMAVAFDTVLTQDVGNTHSIATVNVGDGARKLTLADVPATHLLYLEKQAKDLQTFIEKIPALDAADDWTLDTASNTFKTAPHQVLRTRKVPKVIVLHEPTKEHPAQTQLITEDIVVGTYDTVKFSGAIPQEQKTAMLKRVLALQEALVTAREEANATDVEQQKEGGNIFDFIFGP